MSIKEKYEVRQIQKEETYPWLLKKHYAKRKPPISNAFGLYDNNNTLQGVCTFGLTPSSQICFTICNGLYTKGVLELNRLVINENFDKNVLSYFVSKSLKRLTTPKIIISYSDPNNGHHGYIYQATNWIYTGTSSAKHDYILQNKTYSERHIRSFIKSNMKYDKNLTAIENFERGGGIVKRKKPKHRYVYFLGNKKQKKHMLQNLKYKILQYPKGDNKRYDASFKPDVQGLLF